MKLIITLLCSIALVNGQFSAILPGLTSTTTTGTGSLTTTSPLSVLSASGSNPLSTVTGLGGSLLGTSGDSLTTPVNNILSGTTTALPLAATTPSLTSTTTTGTGSLTGSAITNPLSLLSSGGIPLSTVTDLGGSLLAGSGGSLTTPVNNILSSSGSVSPLATVSGLAGSVLAGSGGSFLTPVNNILGGSGAAGITTALPLGGLMTTVTGAVGSLGLDSVVGGLLDAVFGLLSPFLQPFFIASLGNDLLAAVSNGEGLDQTSVQSFIKAEVSVTPSSISVIVTGLNNVAQAFKNLTTFLVGITCALAKALADALLCLSNRLAIIANKIVNGVFNAVTLVYLDDLLEFLCLSYDFITCVLNALVKNTAEALCNIFVILNCLVNELLLAVLPFSISLEMATTDQITIVNLSILTVNQGVMSAISNFLLTGLFAISLVVGNQLISLLTKILCCVTTYAIEAVTGLGGRLLDYLGISSLIATLQPVSDVASVLLSALHTVITGLKSLCPK